jgi:hypothetical protein
MRLTPLEPTDPHEYVMQLALGHVAARTVHALAHFRIADHLASGARTAADLARLTQAHQASLLRLLRAAAALRLVAEDEELRFVLTPLGEALRAEAPRHAASAALAMGAPDVWRALGELTRSIETGEPLPERLGGAKPFASTAPAQGSRAAQTMIAFYGDEPAAVVEAYDFSPFRLVADIGGSSGNLLSTILRRHHALLGILYDLPYTAAAAREMLEERGVADRCRVISGSFFDSVPAGADAYILSHVIHDWPEEKCELILRNVRRAIPSGRRLLVVEPLVTSGSESDEAKFLDVIALAITGGRHRTLEDFRALLGRTGFRLTRVIATAAEVTILESESV